MSETYSDVENAKSLLLAITTGKNREIFSYAHHKNNKTTYTSDGLVSTVSDIAKWLQTNIQ